MYLDSKHTGLSVDGEKADILKYHLFKKSSRKLEDILNKASNVFAQESELLIHPSLGRHDNHYNHVLLEDKGEELKRLADSFKQEYDACKSSLKENLFFHTFEDIDDLAEKRNKMREFLLEFKEIADGFNIRKELIDTREIPFVNSYDVNLGKPALEKAKEEFSILLKDEDGKFEKFNRRNITEYESSIEILSKLPKHISGMSEDKEIRNILKKTVDYVVKSDPEGKHEEFRAELGRRGMTDLDENGIRIMHLLELREEYSKEFKQSRMMNRYFNRSISELIQKYSKLSIESSDSGDSEKKLRKKLPSWTKRIDLLSDEGRQKLEEKIAVTSKRKNDDIYSIKFNSDGGHNGLLQISRLLSDSDVVSMMEEEIEDKGKFYDSCLGKNTALLSVQEADSKKKIKDLSQQMDEISRRGEAGYGAEYGDSVFSDKLLSLGQKLHDEKIRKEELRKQGKYLVVKELLYNLARGEMRSRKSFKMLDEGIFKNFMDEQDQREMFEELKTAEIYARLKESELISEDLSGSHDQFVRNYALAHYFRSFKGLELIKKNDPEFWDYKSGSYVTDEDRQFRNNHVLLTKRGRIVDFLKEKNVVIDLDDILERGTSWKVEESLNKLGVDDLLELNELYTDIYNGSEGKASFLSNGRGEFYGPSKNDVFGLKRSVERHLLKHSLDLLRKGDVEGSEKIVGYVRSNLREMEPDPCIGALMKHVDKINEYIVSSGDMENGSIMSEVCMNILSDAYFLKKPKTDDNMEIMDGSLYSGLRFVNIAYEKGEEKVLGGAERQKRLLSSSEGVHSREWSQIKNAKYHSLDNATSLYRAFSLVRNRLDDESADNVLKNISSDFYNN